MDMKAKMGPMNGPHKEPKPELKLEARYDSFGDDSEYRSERKERVEKKRAMIKDAIKGMTAEKALGVVKASLEKELKRCEMEAMEYEDGPSISDAYDE